MPSKFKLKKLLAHTLLAQAATFLIATTTSAQMALVIGNSSYKQAPLENPVNDARAISKSLKDSGFAVTEVIDQNREQMKAQVQAFAAQLQTAKQPGLFYFAGHAVQLDWRNYLLPVNQSFTSADDVRNHALDITDLTRGFQAAKNGINIIILDACRDNPFSTAGQMPKGLTQMDAPANTFLAYATAPGQVARDAGSGANGLYTEHLLKELGKEGVKIEDVFKLVRLNVRLASNGEQIPWETTSLENDFYFRRPLRVRNMSERDLENEFEQQLTEWQAVRAARDVLSVEAYLRKYPSGKFSELAHHRLERLLAQKEKRDADITQLQKLMMAAATNAVQTAVIPATSAVVVAAVAVAQAAPTTVVAAAAPVPTPTPPAPVPPKPTAPPPAVQMPVAPAVVAVAPAVAAPPPVQVPPAPVVVAAAPVVVAAAPPVVAPAPALPAASPAMGAAVNPAANPVVIAAATAPQIDGFAAIRPSGIAPGWRVGDALTYRTTERLGAPQTSTAERRAVAVEEDKITTALGNVYDLFGNPLKIQGRYEVVTPPQWFIHEYYVGKRWSTRYKRRSFTGAGDSVVTADMKVIAREQITLPAGKFDAFKVKLLSFNTGSGYNNRSEALLWIDAASSKMIASETRSWGGGGLVSNTRVDLTAFANGVR